MLSVSLMLLLLPTVGQTSSDAHCLDTRALVRVDAIHADAQLLRRVRDDSWPNGPGRIEELNAFYKRPSDGGTIYLFAIAGVRDQEAGYFFDASGNISKRSVISPHSGNIDRRDCAR